MLGLRIDEEFVHRFRDVGDLDSLDHANLAGGLPIAHEIRCRRPGAEIQAAADVLTAQRTLDPDRTLTVAVPARLEPAGRLMTAVEVQHGFSDPGSGRKAQNRYRERKLDSSPLKNS